MSIIITAEIGINHNGDMKICKKLIDVAKMLVQIVLNFKKRYKSSLYTRIS